MVADVARLLVDGRWAWLEGKAAVVERGVGWGVG